ncbi:odorant receptor 135-1 [Danio rerio]|uniref:Odorant receptor n=1 Tax=Danio rerio TaxID=7955 RepID=Q2PRE7_DANRE|nr:odorant receptor 135-1 [Danio rerio]ABC43320.1 odorant receptor [Danio rerio]|eukprot:NP_001077338.1 odorant receptor, family H, subfamily 135, member 1 [Danio rerio]
MNSSNNKQDFLGDCVFKSFFVVLLGVIINCINSILLYTFFKNPVLAQEPRYILYTQLIINDIITLSVGVTLYVFTCLLPNLNVAICCVLVLIASNVFKNTPLNLAGMAIERFVAVCYPLHHAQICTVQNTKILIGIIWLMGALPGMLDFLVVLALRPLSFFTSNRICFLQNVFDFEYHVISHAVFNIVYMCSVWVLLFYTYFKVLFSAKAAASEPAQAQKARRTILLHGVQLLLCTLSLLTTVLDGALTSRFPDYRQIIYYCTFILTSILPRLLSPLIYGLRDQTFKKYMKSSFMCSTKTFVSPEK